MAERIRKISRFHVATDGVLKMLKDYHIPTEIFSEVMAEWANAMFECVDQGICGWCQRHVNINELSKLDQRVYTTSGLCPTCDGEPGKLYELEKVLH